MIIIPYRLTITFTKAPIVNSFIIGITTVIFAFSMFVEPDSSIIEAMVLRDWDIQGMLGSLFLHGGIFHLLGNMVFLWVFGNAICSTVGNALYPLFYLILGICASAMHLLFGGGPAIGASGAINGIVGMAFVLYPVNKLDCVYGFFIPLAGLVKFGKFTVKSYWMIALWVVFDIAGILLGGGHVAYWAHVGGFIGGILLAVSLISFKWAPTYDPTLLDVIAGRSGDDERYSKKELDARIASLNARRTPEPALPLEEPSTAPEAADDIHALWTGDAVPDPKENIPQKGEPVPEPPRPAPKRPPVEDRFTRPLRLTPAVLKLRLLKVVQNNGHVTCYCANDGDEVADLSLDLHDQDEGEIHPSALLKPKEPCWFKLGNPEHGEELPVAISYDDGTGGRGKLLLRLPLNGPQQPAQSKA